MPPTSSATAPPVVLRQPPPPEKKPRSPAPAWESTPFFTGRWIGTRNDWQGDVGIRFVIEKDCRIVALGRNVDTPLVEPAVVALWDADREEAVAQVEVGG